MAKNKRKTTTAIVASVAAALVLLGGTLAWTSISQQAKNEAIVDINPGGRLHDDFNGTNKDVYVENFGDEETGVPIFARIRLDEYMEVGQDAGINKDAADRAVTVLGKNDTTTPDINNVDTWLTYIPGDQDTANDAVANADRVFAPYWEWALGQDDAALLPYYMPTFNKNKDSLKADINGTYQGVVMPYDDYREYAATDTKTADAIYDWDDNAIDEPVPTETRNENDPINSANILLKEEPHTAAQISTVATVITMDQWINDYNKEPGPYWVYDTDGWAYWAQEILPGETTGLLLDSINLTMTPDDNWYYGINVVGQFATAGDIGKLEDPTAEGAELLRVITTPKTIHAVLTENGTVEVDDGTGNGTTTMSAYHLSFVNTREDYEKGDIYVAPGTATLADEATGPKVEIAFDNVGRKNYSTIDEVPWYSYAAQITSASIDSEIQPTSTARWFCDMVALTSVDGLDKIVTSNVTSMAGMFYSCEDLIEIDGISDWDVTNVTDMYALFCRTGITSLDLSNWKTGNVTKMESMFGLCSSLITIEGITDWDTSNVQNMSAMFNGCTSLTTLGLTGWDTSEVTNMYNMFQNCTALTSVGDLSRWVTSSVTNMGSMFRNCNSLKSVGELDDWDVSNVTNMNYLFAGCQEIATFGNLSDWNTSQVTGMQSVFESCTIITTVQGIGNWDVSNVTNMRLMFCRCPALSTLDIAGWDTSSLKATAGMFYGCTSLTNLDLSGTGWNTSGVTTMSGMFQGCSSLEEIIGITGWDTGDVTDMHSMFLNCSGLTTPLDLSGWNVAGVTDHTSFATGAAANMITEPNWVNPDTPPTN